MSINELEMKCRELRQLQALIDEAQAEAHFRKAIEHGSKEAKFNLENLTSLRRH